MAFPRNSRLYSTIAPSILKINLTEKLIELKPGSKIGTNRHTIALTKLTLILRDLLDQR